MTSERSICFGAGKRLDDRVTRAAGILGMSRANFVKGAVEAVLDCIADEIHLNDTPELNRSKIEHDV